MSPTLHADLRQFIGTEEYHRHWMPHLMMTDGLMYLAEHGECFWLTDAIASHLCKPNLCARKHGQRFADFHIWALTPDGNGGAVLESRADDGEPALIHQEIEYTDFPFEDGKPFKLYAAPCGEFYVVMLPSEY